jgi:D-alanyl-D-alanine carboxypeptidase/D-alanyl-D-alanine-endopeptidase (penicillin-binding protein 4)
MQAQRSRPRRRTLALSTLAFCFTFASGIALARSTPARAAEGGGTFEAEVRAALEDKAVAKSNIGVAVARVDAGSSKAPLLLAINASTSLAPASNLKVVTTSAALAVLGPDFRFRTSLVQRENDLFLIGDGDPTLGDPEISTRAGWNYDTVYVQWAAELKRRGVTALRNVYVDDSIFEREFVHPNWPANQLDQPYVAQVAGLNFHFNTIQIEVVSRGENLSVGTTPSTNYVRLSNSAKAGAKNAVGAGRTNNTNDLTVRGEIPRGTTESFEVTVHDPALYGATVLLETLRREGITVSGTVAREPRARQSLEANPNAFTTIGVLETPLPVVLARCNKDSANLYAECLAKRVAAKATNAPGSWAGSRATIGAWLEKLGVPQDEFNLDDGCGLSKENRVTAEMMVRILAHNFAAPYRQTFIDSLAIGGVDGTLEKRFGELRGRVHAKSGYINGVWTLSGYLQARNNNWYAFSILINGGAGGKPTHERIVNAIDRCLP